MANQFMLLVFPKNKTPASGQASGCLRLFEISGEGGYSIADSGASGGFMLSGFEQPLQSLSRVRMSVMPFISHFRVSLSINWNLLLKV